AAPRDEQEEQAEEWDEEVAELTAIYEKRGLTPETAAEVTRQLMAKDALGAHARDELGITEVSSANPIQAALTSAATFTAGAALPLLAAWLTFGNATVLTVSVVSLIVLAVLGALGAQTGGASVWKGALRVAFWGVLAMAVTYGVGAVFGTVTG
ncbi:MAG: VIT1/CCC1 transporter family protein, partial [Devosia sp.]